MLDCPGAFGVPLPDGWRVEGDPADHVLLLPPSGAGEVRIAAFPRAPGPLGDHEGSDRLAELLAELGVDTDDEGNDVRTRVRMYADSHRGLAWFEAYDADGHDVDCLAAVVVSPAVVVALTARARVRSHLLAAVEVMVASIVPG